jgi:CBS domain-containing protein
MARLVFSKKQEAEQVTEGQTAVVEGDARTAKDIMQCGITAVGQDESVYKAIGILADNHVGGLPVVDGSALAGLISEKDVLELLFQTEFLPGLVKEYMTTDVVTFGLEDRLSDICECLMTHSFRRVPIVHEGRLAGLITRSDLIRASKDRFAAPGQTARRRREDLEAQDVMKCGLLTVRKETAIHDVVNILATRHVTGLPVVDDCMRLRGIITEKDVLRLLYDPQAAACCVEQIMTEDVVSFNKDDSLFKVCECLTHNNFHRVPVLDDGRLVGIISRADLMVYILRNKSTVFNRRKMDS